jgi:hypothetical protein
LISGADVEKKIERAPAGQPGQQRDEANNTNDNASRAPQHKEPHYDQGQAQYDAHDTIDTTNILGKHFCPLISILRKIVFNWVRRFYPFHITLMQYLAKGFTIDDLARSKATVETKPFSRPNEQERHS